MVPGNLADFLSPNPTEVELLVPRSKITDSTDTLAGEINLPVPSRSMIGEFANTLKGSSSRYFVNLNDKFNKVYIMI